MDLAIQAFTSKYGKFSGRARRMEFWLFQLFYFIFFVIAQILDSSFDLAHAETGIGPITGIFWLATLIPAISVSVRRLHDTDKMGWWYLLILVPLLGAIILIVFFIMKGTKGGNDYGEDPLEVTS